MKSGKLNFLEPSGQLEACNGTALPFTLLLIQLYENTRNNVPVLKSALRAVKCGKGRVPRILNLYVGEWYASWPGRLTVDILELVWMRWHTEKSLTLQQIDSRASLAPGQRAGLPIMIYA
jgi:hypothetical protein